MNKKSSNSKMEWEFPGIAKLFHPLNFFSAESRDGLIAFFASPLRSPFSLFLHSLLHPNFRCTRPQFFATSWPALRAESTSGSVFSLLNRGVYIYMCMCMCMSIGVSTKRERKKEQEEENEKKKDREKKVPPSKVSTLGFSLAFSALDRTKLSAVLQMKRSLCRVAAASRSLQACLAANPFFRTMFHQDRSK